MADQVQKFLEIADDELILGWRNSEWTGIAPRLVELRLVPDWAATIARHHLYERADEERIAALRHSDDAEIAGLAAKIDREEAYHRMHAQMWFERLQDEPRFQAALEELRP